VIQEPTVDMIPASYDSAATFAKIDSLNPFYNFLKVTTYKRIDPILSIRPAGTKERIRLLQK